MPAAKEKTEIFINATSNNIYTEAGRCAPKATVELTVDQAKAHKGLELASSYKQPEPEKETEE